jgi:exopolyphosphatase/guanosine-5'-triphosphate,3'-diphosphate pyrophosphatase
MGHTGEFEPMGVVDIGSNSVRLVVYEGAVRSPTPIFNEKVLAGLGRSVASTGRIDEAAVERALAALVRFRAICRILAIKNLRAIATAACREARNGADFVRRGEQALGARIEVLSGEEEADLAAKGIMMGFRDPDGIAGDLGGGSLELIDITGADLRGKVTLPLGGLRLIDTSGGRIDQALETADAELAGVPWLGRAAGRPFYAVGGTWRALARMHMEATDYPLRVMHGYALPAKEAIEFCEDLRRSRKLTGLKGAEHISKARREVLPYGALVMERFLRRAKPGAVIFSVFGIREGLLFKLLSAVEQKRDPLLSFAADYARLHSRSEQHAFELTQWTDGLFLDGGPSETPEERRLRHAACLLSDIGWRAHPDFRGEQSLNVIAHSALGGVDHPGRIFLALAIYFRHVGPGEDEEEAVELSARLQRLVPNRVLKRARIVGAAIRAAHMISIGRAGLIDETSLFHDKDKLVLALPRQHAALDGERLRRRFAALADLLDRKPEIRIGR